MRAYSSHSSSTIQGSRIRSIVMRKMWQLSSMSALKNSQIRRVSDQNSKKKEDKLRSKSRMRTFLKVLRMQITSFPYVRILTRLTTRPIMKKLINSATSNLEFVSSREYFSLKSYNLHQSLKTHPKLQRRIMIKVSHQNRKIANTT